jgi:hypothetical protein
VPSGGVHLAIRTSQERVNRIDRLRDELGKDVGVKLTRSQAIRMLLDEALPKAEKRLGIYTPHDEAAA